MTWSGTAPAPEGGLGALQAWLFKRVSCPEGCSAPGLRPALDREHERVVAGGLLSASERIGIYRRGYWSRLGECLRDDYPGVAHALGAEVFLELCHEFIAAHPPASASLNFYGAPFAAFCASRSAPEMAFAAALARLEWAVVEVIHADAERTFGAAALAAEPGLDLEHACLEPSAALRVLNLSHPAPAYYQAFLDGEMPLVPEAEASWVAVCRRDDDIWRVQLEAPFAAVLERLIAGEPLGRALAALPEEEADGASARAVRLQRAFCEWVTCGFFAGVSALG